MKLLLKNPIVFFDIEATSLDIIQGRIVEISLIKLYPNGERAILNKVINPEIPIPLESSLIHGIYDEDVIDKPIFKNIAKDIVNFIKGADLGGFNILKFDIPILAESCLRENINFSIEKKKIVDVQRVFHLMEKRNLTAAYKFYCNKELEKAHSAFADNEATIDVFLNQITKYFGKDVMDLNGNRLSTVNESIESIDKLNNKESMIDYAGRLIYDGDKMPIFNFGKYKGQSVEKVLKADPVYFDWMMKSQFPLDTKAHLTKLKLEFSRTSK